MLGKMTRLVWKKCSWSKGRERRDQEGQLLEREFLKWKLIIFEDIKCKCKWVDTSVRSLSKEDLQVINALSVKANFRFLFTQSCTN